MVNVISLVKMLARLRTFAYYTPKNVLNIGEPINLIKGNALYMVSAVLNPLINKSVKNLIKDIP